MSDWTLWQFGDVVGSFMSGLDVSNETKVTAKLDTLMKKGNLSGRPLTAPLRDGILELQCHGRLDLRLLFFWGEQKRIIFVHALKKKTRRVQDQDIELAIERKKLIESGKAKISALDYAN
jgi:phage-related protein